MLCGIALSPLILNRIRVAEWGKVEDIMEKACRLTRSPSHSATAEKHADQRPSFHRLVWTDGCSRTLFLFLRL